MVFDRTIHPQHSVTFRPPVIPAAHGVPLIPRDTPVSLTADELALLIHGLTLIKESRRFSTFSFDVAMHSKAHAMQQRLVTVKAAMKDET